MGSRQVLARVLCAKLHVLGTRMWCRNLRARALPDACDGVVGKTVLHYACEEGHENVATMLIAAGADITAKDRDGNNPCELARQKDMGMMAKRLEKHVASSLRNWLSDSR